MSIQTCITQLLSLGFRYQDVVSQDLQSQMTKISKELNAWNVKFKNTDIIALQTQVNLNTNRILNKNVDQNALILS